MAVAAACFACIASGGLLVYFPRPATRIDIQAAAGSPEEDHIVQEGDRIVVQEEDRILAEGSHRN